MRGRTKFRSNLHFIDCPDCGGMMVYFPNGPYGPYFRCVNRPCKGNHMATKSGRHPVGVEADLDTRRLRHKAHRLGAFIWPNQETMYSWLKQNTRAGHFGQMTRAELEEALTKMLPIAQRRQRELEAEAQRERETKMREERREHFLRTIGSIPASPKPGSPQAEGRPEAAATARSAVLCDRCRRGTDESASVRRALSDTLPRLWSNPIVTFSYHNIPSSVNTWG